MRARGRVRAARVAVATALTAVALVFVDPASTLHAQPIAPPAPAAATSPFAPVATYQSTCGRTGAACCFCPTSIGKVGTPSGCPADGTLCWTDVRGERVARTRSESGSATLSAYGVTVPMRFTFDPASKFVGTGARDLPAGTWSLVAPGVEARATSPGLRVEITSAPPRVSAKFTPGTLELRTTARKPDGSPLATATARVDSPLDIDDQGEVALASPSWPAPAPISVPAFCDAACPEIDLPRLPPDAAHFDGKIAIPPSHLGAIGRLDYVDRWQNQCELFAPDRAAGTGRCKRDTVCLPGQQRVRGEQPTACVTVPPAPPRLPTTLRLGVSRLLR